MLSVTPTQTQLQTLASIIVMASTTVSLCCCVFLQQPCRPSFTSPRTRTQEHSLETLALSCKSSKSAARIGLNSFGDFGERLHILRRLATKSLTHNGSKRGRYIVYQKHHDLLTTPTEQFCEPISGNLRGFSTVSTVIQGYWFGPDIEDGCGYIEAIVDRVF